LDRIDIKSMALDELQKDFAELEFQKFRAGQVYKWLHSGVSSFDEMTNISKDLRQKLQERYFIAGCEIEVKRVSKIDGTVKYLYKLHDGEYIEAVVMKYHHGNSICISSQVGCKMGCTFCATGKNGFTRNLLPSEMLSEIQVAQKDIGERISNIVLMGMGEPLDNYDNVLKFLKLVSDENGMNIGMRHISLSTCGVVPGIYRLAEVDIPITLSISLHASNDEKRSEIMPVNKKWNISALLSACVDYYKVTGRRISFEYTLISGKNDSEADARELATLLTTAFRGTGAPIHVNLIRVNEVKETGFKKGSTESVNAFAKTLESLGVTATVRRKLGSDVNAACGQLRRSRLEKEQIDN